MIKTPIHRWDAVDVQLENGTKQFGYVVDIAEDGLVIDFGNGAPLSVPKRRIRQPRTAPCPSPDSDTSESNRRGSMENPNAYNWEAVVQVSPAAPYTWYPARVLLSNDGLNFSLVEILINDRKQEYVLPLDHVRRPYSFKNYLDGRPVWTVFRKTRTLWMPKDFVLDERVQNLWMEEVPQRKIIGVKEGYLYYLMADEPKTEEIPQIELRLLKKTFDLCKSEPDSAEKHMENSSQHPTTPGGGDKCPDINKTIPPEILLKIFKLLNTVMQARARGVCTKWNALLHSPDIVSEVHMHFTPATKKRKLRNADICRKIAACVHKNISDHTQKLTLSGSFTWQVYVIVDGILSFLRSKPLETLILSDCQQPFCYWDDRRPVVSEGNRIFQLDEIFGKICRYLVFDNVTFADVNCDFVSEYEDNSISPVPKNCLSIHIVSGRIDLQSPSGSSDFWHLLEKYCPWVDLESSIVPAAFKSAMVMDLDDHGERALWTAINQILYGLESCDPRASKKRRSMFTLNEFPDFSAIDARSLHKLTLTILDKVFRQNYRPLIGKFAIEPEEILLL